MKQLFLTAILTLGLAIPAFAADVVISLTIPDAYVSRVADAVGSLNCDDGEGGQLSPQECLKAKIIRELADFVTKYEEGTAKALATQAYKDTMAEYMGTRPPIPVN